MLDSGLVDLFLKGGIVMWPLLGCSIVALAIILERSIIFLRSGMSFAWLREFLLRQVRAGRLDQAADELSHSRSPVARVASVYLRHARTEKGPREEAVTREASQEVARLEQRLNWLAMLAHITPLLGLLGTVIGLMVAFHQMDVKGAQVQTTDLAIGIWQKLLNTAFGMIIAIPCLVCYYWLESRLRRTTQEMEWITSYLEEWLEPGDRSVPPVREAPSANGPATPRPAGQSAPTTQEEPS